MPEFIVFGRGAVKTMLPPYQGNADAEGCENHQDACTANVQHDLRSIPELAQFRHLCKQFVLAGEERCKRRKAEPDDAQRFPPARIVQNPLQHKDAPKKTHEIGKKERPRVRDAREFVDDEDENQKASTEEKERRRGFPERIAGGGHPLSYLIFCEHEPTYQIGRSPR